MADVGDLPEGLHNIPVNLSKHWSILDQTKAEFEKSGRSGVIIINDEQDSDYPAKVNAFLAKFGNTKWPMKKPYLVIEHATEARQLYEAIIKAGLKAELIEQKT